MRAIQETTPTAIAIADGAVAQTPAKLSLLERYQPHSDVFFSSRACTLLAKPPFANLLKVDNSNLAQHARHSLRFAKELGLQKPVVIGAVNFEGDESSYLRLSAAVETRKGHEHFDHLDGRHLKPIHSQIPSQQAIPEPAQFGASVRQALAKFARGELDKVVLSRTLQIHYPSAIDSHQLVTNLALKNRTGYTFAINLKPVEQLNREVVAPSVHALVGASPELLIAKKGLHLMAQPLAGSEPRTHIDAVDSASEARLMASAKDRREHALVIQAIREALTPYCKTLHIPDTPSIVRTPTMLHLGTLIEGELNNTSTSSLDLALAMHPTPAVCGYPTLAAKAAIRELEDYDRHLFTGMVGWCDDQGDGEWAVTIRCAEVKDNAITVYAGAGIVAGSCPDKETRETAAKFNTLLQAMGVAQQ